MRCSQTHRRMIWLVGLKDDFSRAVGAARATCDLCEQLKGPFGGAEIREGEALVGKGDADQGDPGDVVSLGNHLRTDEHIDFTAPQPIENPLDPITRRCIAIEPCDAGLRKALLDSFLKLFGTDSKSLVLRAPTGRAGDRDRPMEIAVVTSKRTLPPMLGQSDAAGRALGHHAAGSAPKAWRKAAPIEKDDRLMTRFKTAPERGKEGARDQGMASRADSMSTQIDDFDLGHACTGCSRRQ
jgi:hypothetical protein